MTKSAQNFQTAGNAGYFFMSEPLDGAYRGKYITVPCVKKRIFIHFQAEVFENEGGGYLYGGGYL